jgi:hypothetical protein
MSAGYTRSNDTGQGATITFAVGSFVADFRSIGETSQESPKVKDSNLTNAEYESYIPGDLIDGGETECELNFNRRAALPALNTPGLITITYPLGPGDATAATLIGTGDRYAANQQGHHRMGWQGDEASIHPSHSNGLSFSA